MSGQRISVFDMFKVGIGPSSSHTMGPWRAAQRFLRELPVERVSSVRCILYGSLAKTGRGHGTDVAVTLGLAGEDPEWIDPASLDSKIGAVQRSGKLRLGGTKEIEFGSDAIGFDYTTETTVHPNTLTLTAWLEDGSEREETFYSLGGGFIRREGDPLVDADQVALPYPINHGWELEQYCERHNCSIPAIVFQNELAWNSVDEVKAKLARIAAEMIGCAHRGCRQTGILPGGLMVRRRAATIASKLVKGPLPETAEQWVSALQDGSCSFSQTLKWVSCFALAVNEENAAFGRVVTAPTNGAAGVIPAVLLYMLCFVKPSSETEFTPTEEFLLTAGELGSLFMKGATISAAMGGCQAEIGVSSAMAAGALAHCLGGTPSQVTMAAEIAMEHHLGMTCDPIGGLVQVPCIERNMMGAMKAITAANMAIEGDPTEARVTLDEVIRTMWQTALDMNSKYKETSEGGLAVHVPVGVAEC